MLICADMQDNTMERCFGEQQSNKELIKSIITKPQINLDTGTNGIKNIYNKMSNMYYFIEEY